MKFALLFVVLSSDLVAQSMNRLSKLTNTNYNNVAVHVSCFPSLDRYVVKVFVCERNKLSSVQLSLKSETKEKLIERAKLFLRNHNCWELLDKQPPVICISKDLNTHLYYYRVTFTKTNKFGSTQIATNLYFDKNLNVFSHTNVDDKISEEVEKAYRRDVMELE